MKKTLICIILALAMLFTLTSCAEKKDVCYYGCFGNTAMLLIYSSRSNSLYEINIPVEQIILWGRANGIENMGSAMRSYVALREDGFMSGNAQVLTAVRDILTALSNEKTPDSLARLRVLTDRPELLSNSRLIDNMNRLCGTDFSALTQALKNNNIEVRCFDAGTFLDTDDIVYSQSYFRRWLGQVLGEEI